MRHALRRRWSSPSGCGRCQFLASASTYTSKAHLHWSGVTLNGGAINAEGGDAVEIVAYFGEASGTANGSLERRRRERAEIGIDLFSSPPRRRQA